jgi:hypothetical protein
MKNLIKGYGEKKGWDTLVQCINCLPRSNIGVMGSNLTVGMDVYLFYSVFVVPCRQRRVDFRSRSAVDCLYDYENVKQRTNS